MSSDLNSLVESPSYGGNNSIAPTLLQKGVHHFIKTFAWYIAILVVIIGIALAMGTVLDIDIGSRAFVLNTVLLLSGSLLVYSSFVIDGRQSGTNNVEYKELCARYKQSRKAKARATVESHLIQLAQDYQVEFIKSLCFQLTKTEQEILEIDTTSKEVNRKYKRNTIKAIRCVQQSNYPNPYPKDANIVLYALSNDANSQRQFNGYASREYLIKQATIKVITSLMIATIVGGIVVNITEKNVVQIIFSIIGTMLTIAISIASGWRHGYVAITIYKAGVIEYCADLLDGIKEVENV